MADVVYITLGTIPTHSASCLYAAADTRWLMWSKFALQSLPAFGSCLLITRQFTSSNLPCLSEQHDTHPTVKMQIKLSAAKVPTADIKINKLEL